MRSNSLIKNVAPQLSVVLMMNLYSTLQVELRDLFHTFSKFQNIVACSDTQTGLLNSTQKNRQEYLCTGIYSIKDSEKYWIDRVSYMAIIYFWWKILRI